MNNLPTYTKQQVVDATLSYFKGDEIATDVFLKYCLQDKEGNYRELTPVDMFKRLSSEFSRIEQKYPNPVSEKEIFKQLDRV